MIVDLRTQLAQTLGRSSDDPVLDQLLQLIEAWQIRETTAFEAKEQLTHNPVLTQISSLISFSGTTVGGGVTIGDVAGGNIFKLIQQQGIFVALDDQANWDRVLTNEGYDIQEIIERCQRASVLEMKAVGSKYIADLYFPRSQIEANFKSFLTSDSTCFLVVAKAGRGKTNLLCHLTEALQHQHPTLFISGRVEPRDSNGILVQIASRLGYGENWLACFKDLSLLAAKGLVPLIVVDGINESATHPKTMQAALRELLFQASSSKVKVCVTCRTDFWRFYRAPFWGEYSWRDPISHSSKTTISQDLPFFPPEEFDRIVSRYFDHFHIQGKLIHDAWESCRNPLLLRFFCEAYNNRNVGKISQIRLYPLFSFFWDRKIENIQDIVGEPDPYRIHKLILTLARLMYQQHKTKVSKEVIAKEIEDNLRQPGSLYLRVLDEEIILEEELDELRGDTNVIFVYDKFSEYAIALSIFSDRRWLSKSDSGIITDIITHGSLKSGRKNEKLVNSGNERSPEH